MAYSAYAVANAFVQKAIDGRLSNLSPMKLQKLMYFAQAWHLKIVGTPLLDDNFSRWQYGPVIPAIYHEFKAYGFQSINKQATTLSMDDRGYTMNVPSIPLADESTWDLIDAIVNKYGHLSGPALSSLTHQPGSAWAQGQPDGSAITADQIKSDPTIQ